MKKTKVVQLVLLTTALTLAQQEGFSQSQTNKKNSKTSIQSPKTKKDTSKTKQAQIVQPQKKQQKDSISRSNNRATTSTNYGSNSAGKVFTPKRTVAKKQHSSSTTTISKTNSSYTPSTSSKTYSSPSTYSSGNSSAISRGGFGGRSSSSAS